MIPELGFVLLAKYVMDWEVRMVLHQPNPFKEAQIWFS